MWYRCAVRSPLSRCASPATRLQAQHTPQCPLKRHPPAHSFGIQHLLQLSTSSSSMCICDNHVNRSLSYELRGYQGECSRTVTAPEMESIDEYVRDSSLSGHLFESTLNCRAISHLIKHNFSVIKLHGLKQALSLPDKTMSVSYGHP